MRRSASRRARFVDAAAAVTTARICSIVRNRASSSTSSRPAARRDAIAARYSPTLTGGWDIRRYGTSI